jgi:hypothetical protein
VAAAAIFLILAIFLSKAAEHGKLISDESAYAFQARVFASGEWKARPMPGATINPRAVPPEIHFEQTIQSTRGWFAKYPPGWPLLLALGYLAHVPWLVNPVLGATQLALAWWIARRWGRATQILTVVLAATSPFLLMSSIGYMAHACEGTLSLLALGALLEGIDRKKLSWIAFCFLLVVAATEVRPFTGAALATLCAGICLYEFRTDRPFLLRSLPVIGLAAAASVGLLLLTNRLFTGNALLSPYAFARGTAKVQELTLAPRTILHGLLHTTRWTFTETLRFTFPFIILLAIYACARETARRRELVYCALFFPLLVLAYMLQTEASASIHGERYYFEGFCLIAIVAARGIESLAQTWRLPATSVFAVMAVMLALQAASLAVTVKDVEDLLSPYREAYRLAYSAPSVPLVFLSGETPEFTPKHVNWNHARWWRAATIEVNDPGPGRRHEVACRYGKTSYRVVQYLPDKRMFLIDDAIGACPAAPAP